MIQIILKRFPSHGYWSISKLLFGIEEILFQLELMLYTDI